MADSKALLIPLDETKPSRAEIKVMPTRNPRPAATLGEIGLAVKLSGPKSFGLARLVVPFDRKGALGVDLATVRFFRFEGDRFAPVWNSGVNPDLGQIWAKIDRPGVYVAIGLPRDRLLWEILREMSSERRLRMATDEGASLELTRRALGLFTENAPEAVDEVRRFFARLEVQTGLTRYRPEEIKMGTGGHVEAFALPGDASGKEFTRRINQLRPLPDGLPEEQLFYPPEIPRADSPPWDLSPREHPWRGVSSLHWHHIDILRDLNLRHWHWLYSTDWWMYQHDVQHTGRASGASDITATTVNRMYRLASVNVDGPVVTKPCIVDGKIFVGSGRSGGTGGTLYRIDLSTGTIEQSMPTSGVAFYGWVNGIGGSPAVTGGRVYFTGVHGKVYCVNASTFALVWETDLKNPSQAQNQPIRNPDGDCWSSPLVVNGRVYVASGEGESPTPFGFIWCLNAMDGRVVWVYCTNKFVDPNNAGNENQPNVIPRSAATTDPLPAWATSAGFTLRNNPPHRGSSPWSSAAYDATLNRIYICTGNSIPDNPLPDERYASGIISLDATSGQFRGFFQPAPSDSYAALDWDVDVPGAPTIFTRGSERVLCFGSKNGSFWLLNPDTMAVLARRQLLPRRNGTGLPGSPGTSISAVVPHAPAGSGENRWGVMATPAVHGASGKLFVGLGGYGGMQSTNHTPFLRALNWTTLDDAWPVTLGSDGIRRYSATNPPMYLTLEPGLSSPGVVNDVVFMSTGCSGTNSAMYALDIVDGHCLWSAPGIPNNVFALGPAISGNYVVLGAGNQVHIYKLRPPRPWWYDMVWLERYQFPIPRPDPPFRFPFPWPIPFPLPPQPDPPPFFGGEADRFQE